MNDAAADERAARSLFPRKDGLRADGPTRKPKPRWHTTQSPDVLASICTTREQGIEAGASGDVTVVGGDTYNHLAYRVQAHAVSSDGWIVGDGWVALPGGGAEYHGFLLKPITCVGDIDGSCSVNGADLGILLGAWSCGSPCPSCLADLNRDGLINGSDLGILLGAWGSSCKCWSCPSGSRGSAAQEAVSDSEGTLIDGLAILGFNSVAEFNASQSARTDAQNAEVLEWLYIYLTARD